MKLIPRRGEKVEISRRSLINLAFAVALLAGLGFFALQRGGTVEQPVQDVVEGDTLFIGATKVRLEGIAVPAPDEPGGVEARQYLSHLALGKTAVCHLSGGRSWDRIDARCEVEGLDLAEAMVRAGLARDCPRRSDGRYGPFETDRGRQLALPARCAVDAPD